MRQMTLFFEAPRKKQIKDAFIHMDALYHQINAYEDSISKSAAQFNWMQVAFAIEKCENIKIHRNRERLRKARLTP